MTKIGETEVFSIAEAAVKLDIAPVTLRLQIKNGALDAKKIGKQWVIEADALTAYDERRKEPRGFAREDHPMKGKQGPGHRRKKENENG